MNQIKSKKYPSDFRKSGENDLKWYNNYPILSNGLIGANFTRRKGISDVTSSATNFYVPSVASFATTLTVGKTLGDSYKTAIDKLYTSLRSANTGSVQYTKLDLQGYLLNLRTILAEVRVLRRAYGVLKKFDLMDKTVPISLFKAMGLDYDTFVNNAANLRNELNYISVQLHTLMPYKSDLLERTAWMFDNIFTDSNDAKAQLYLFTLSPYLPMYDFSSNTISDITPLSAIINFANTATTTGTIYNTAIANLRSHISTATASDKVAIIAADILKAFGTGMVGYFSEIPENYSVNYVYSEEVLTQIQNARILGGTRSSTAVQDSGIYHTISGNYIQAEAHFAGGSAFDDGADVLTTYTYVNMYKNEISNLDLIGATRLAWTATADTAVTTRYILDSFGTEVLTNMVFVYKKPYGDSSSYAYDLFGWGVSSFNPLAYIDSSSTANSMIIPTLWATFDWAPRLTFSRVSYRNTSGTLATTGLGASPLWDFNNYALVEPNQLDSYHDIAVLSLNYCDSLVRNVNLIPVK